jgi:hypothetical protein
MTRERESERERARERERERERESNGKAVRRGEEVERRKSDGTGVEF